MLVGFREIFRYKLLLELLSGLSRVDVKKNC